MLSSGEYMFSSSLISNGLNSSEFRYSKHTLEVVQLSERHVMKVSLSSMLLKGNSVAAHLVHSHWLVAFSLYMLSSVQILGRHFRWTFALQTKHERKWDLRTTRFWHILHKVILWIHGSQTSATRKQGSHVWSITDPSLPHSLLLTETDTVKAFSISVKHFCARTQKIMIHPLDTKPVESLQKGIIKISQHNWVVRIQQ